MLQVTEAIGLSPKPASDHMCTHAGMSVPGGLMLTQAHTPQAQGVKTNPPQFTPTQQHTDNSIPTCLDAHIACTHSVRGHTTAHKCTCVT